MKPWDMVSSLRGANTIFSGAADKRTDTEKRETEERNRREIRGATRDAGQGRSKQQIQRGTRTAPRRNVRGSEYIVNRDCSDD
jgi:hypothetical protein